MLRIELVKSPIGNNKRNRATVAALGLRKVHQVVIQPDNPSIRGLVFHVKHMLSVTEVEGTKPAVEVAAAAEVEPEAKPAKKPRAKKESEPSESQ
jgi:large subunit ribosomal protein L30